MQKLLRYIHVIEDTLLASLLVGMILLAVAQIVLRNWFDSGLLWADPMLRVMVLWVGLLGALAATRESRHISIDVFNRLFNPQQKHYLQIGITIFSAIITSILAYYSLRFVLAEYDADTQAFSHIPLWLMSLIMPIGFGLMSLRFVLQSLTGILSLYNRDAVK